MPPSRSNNGAALVSSKSTRHKPTRAPRKRTVPAVQRSVDLRKSGDHQRSSTAALDDTNVDWEARARSQQAILDNIADAVVVADNEGRLTYFNPVAEDLIGARAPELPPDQWSENYGIYYPDTKTLFPSQRLPLARALGGESVLGVELFIRHAKRPDGVPIVASARPVYAGDGSLQGAVVVFRDISDRKSWEKELEQQLAVAHERSETLDRMHRTIQELSTPILEIWNEVLVLPIIGILDSRRSGEITEQLLAEVAGKACRFVIIDVTGVEVVDSSTADRLLRLVNAVELLGARCLLTGVRPAVAQTLASLRVDLGPLLTLRNLRHGLETCIRLSNMGSTSAQLQRDEAMSARSAVRR